MDDLHNIREIYRQVHDGLCTVTDFVQHCSSEGWTVSSVDGWQCTLCRTAPSGEVEWRDVVL